MTTTADRTGTRWGTWRAPSNLALLVALGAVALLAFVGLLIWDDARTTTGDVESDRWYCSQESSSVFDRGPNTGQLCGEILNG